MSLITSWLCAYLALLVRLVSSTTTVNLCGQFDAYSSTAADGYRTTYNNNVWGNDSSGSQCLDIDKDGGAFTVTYKWLGAQTLVKSFPYFKVFPPELPLPLENVVNLTVAGEWSTTVTSETDDSPAAQARAYDEISLHANVAVDMFLSPNALNSTGAGPPIEIMIWFWWTPTVRPLGWNESTPDVDTVTVDGTAFRLYHGYNDRRQHVFSWLADTNLTSANADYGPLLSYVWRKGLLSGDLFVGQLEFGTEILHAGDETVFTAKNYRLGIVKGDPPVMETSTSVVATVAPTSSAARTSATAPPATTSSSAADGLRKSYRTGIMDLLLGATIFMLG